MNYRLILVFLVSTTLSFCADPSNNQIGLDDSYVNHTGEWGFNDIDLDDSATWAFNTSEPQRLPVLTLPVREASPATGASAQKRTLTNPSPSDEDSDSDSDLTTTSAFSPYPDQGLPIATNDLDNKTCTHCTTFFSTLEALQMHKKRYPDGKCILSTCPICNNFFGNPGALITHRKAYPDGYCDKPLKCKYCGKGFKHPSVLKEHMKQYERANFFDASSITCTSCGKVCGNPGGLVSHKKTHSGQLSEPLGSLEQINVAPDPISLDNLLKELQGPQ